MIVVLAAITISSHEPKAQLSFSDQNFSIVVVVVNFSHFYLLPQNHLAQSILNILGAVD